MLYDGDLAGLVERFAPHKIITVELKENAAVGSEEVTAMLRATSVAGHVEQTAVGFTVYVPRAHTPAVAGRLLAGLPVADLTVEGAADRAGDGRLCATVAGAALRG